MNKSDYIDLVSVWTVGCPLSDVICKDCEEVIALFNARYVGENRIAQITMYITLLKQYSEISMFSSSEKMKVNNLIERLSVAVNNQH